MLMDYNPHLFNLEHHSFMTNIKLCKISFISIMRNYEDLDVRESGRIETIAKL